jgi:hypothetical protein
MQYEQLKRRREQQRLNSHERYKAKKIMLPVTLENRNKGSMWILLPTIEMNWTTIIC